MQWHRKNMAPYSFSVMKIGGLAIVLLALAVLWQTVLLYRKDHTIADLLSENVSLKKNLSSIDGQLVELQDTATDVRIFQRELITVMKDLNQSYPVTFASSQKKSQNGFYAVTNDPPLAVKDAQESIFKLSSSHENLRFETASMLTNAVAIRDILAKTPSMIPAAGHISSDFGIRLDPFTGRPRAHRGVDIAAPRGTAVFAAADGKVITAGHNTDLGNRVEILHGDGHVTAYGHLSEKLVKKGDQVKRGQEIGRVGNSGRRCSGNHVHYEVRLNGVRKDPKPFMVSSPLNIL